MHRRSLHYVEWKVMTKFGRSIFITNFANAKQIIMLKKTEKNKYKGHPQRSKGQSKITILTSIED